jgi:hypothetical protein
MAKKQSKLFEYINAISLTKNEDFLEDIDFAKQYVPFVVNRAFSYHPDSVLAANIVNERSWLAPELQARMLLNTLRSRKRYSPWLKNSVSDDVKAVAEYYGCSIRHAKSLTELHTSAQLLTLRSRLYKGGFAPEKGTGYDDSTSP